jgi:hypothetical protein
LPHEMAYQGDLAGGLTKTLKASVTTREPQPDETYAGLATSAQQLQENVMIIWRVCSLPVEGLVPRPSRGGQALLIVENWRDVRAYLRDAISDFLPLSCGVAALRLIEQGETCCVGSAKQATLGSDEVAAVRGNDPEYGAAWA